MTVRDTCNSSTQCLITLYCKLDITFSNVDEKCFPTDRNLMRVPSAVLAEGSNVILNPPHPDFEHVESTVVRPFSFDQRMFKQSK